MDTMDNTVSYPRTTRAIGQAQHRGNIHKGAQNGDRGNGDSATPVRKPLSARARRSGDDTERAATGGACVLRPSKRSSTEPVSALHCLFGRSSIYACTAEYREDEQVS